MEFQNPSYHASKRKWVLTSLSGMVVKEMHQATFLKKFLLEVVNWTGVVMKHAT